MNKECETCQALISGYLDDELDPGERAALEAHIASCPVCRDELEKMRRLVSASSDLRVPPPTDEEMDRFLDGVYNRLERKTGWLIVIIGVVALALWGIYLFITEPGRAWVKLMIAAPLVGLAVLFVSVLRQRLAVAKHDRYSKEIRR